VFFCWPCIQFTLLVHDYSHVLLLISFPYIFLYSICVFCSMPDRLFWFSSYFCFGFLLLCLELLWFVIQLCIDFEFYLVFYFPIFSLHITQHVFLFVCLFVFSLVWFNFVYFLFIYFLSPVACLQTKCLVSFYFIFILYFLCSLPGCWTVLILPPPQTFPAAISPPPQVAPPCLFHDHPWLPVTTVLLFCWLDWLDCVFATWGRHWLGTI